MNTSHRFAYVMQVTGQSLRPVCHTPYLQLALGCFAPSIVPPTIVTNGNVLSIIDEWPVDYICHCGGPMPTSSMNGICAARYLGRRGHREIAFPS